MLYLLLYKTIGKEEDHHKNKVCLLLKKERKRSSLDEILFHLSRTYILKCNLLLGGIVSTVKPWFPKPVLKVRFLLALSYESIF
jgi:hypothetical protein